jgi:hypothetical protein
VDCRARQKFSSSLKNTDFTGVVLFSCAAYTLCARRKGGRSGSRNYANLPNRFDVSNENDEPIQIRRTR